MVTDARLLGGRYELGEPLGYGGMAEVHRGRDVRLGRDVAVKILRADLARDPAFQARFRREAQSAAALNHPAIVSVYDTGDDSTGEGTVPYIVMEYVEGRTLRDVLRNEGRLLPERALEVTADVLGALDYSHRAGIVHRDIKPANVMLTRSGDVKVMDFGIARALATSAATMTQTAEIIGTAHYLSPEQARGEHVDARSDIYSTGCLLFELITGRPPFTGDSPVAVAYQHVREDPTPPSHLVEDVSPAIDAIVLKALAKNPANRYQSAAEMRADIERALAGRPVEATPILDMPTTVTTAATETMALRRGPDEREPRRGLAYFLLFLGVLLIFAAVAFIARNLAGSSSPGVTTPNVKGLTLAQAEQALATAHLHVGDIKQAYNDQFAAGVVSDQDPVGGIRTDRNSGVDLTISKGAAPVKVPQLVGQQQAAAENALAAAGLRLGNVTTMDAAAPQGQVLQQDPLANTAVQKASQVSIVVASGNTPVPNVVGQDQASASAALQQQHFVVKVVQVQSATGTPGQVISQNPPGGKAPYGSTVTITVVAQQSPSPTPTSPTPTSPTPTSPSITPTSPTPTSPTPT